MWNFKNLFKSSQTSQDVPLPQCGSSQCDVDTFINAFMGNYFSEALDAAMSEPAIMTCYNDWQKISAVAPIVQKRQSDDSWVEYRNHPLTERYHDPLGRENVYSGHEYTKQLIYDVFHYGEYTVIKRDASGYSTSGIPVRLERVDPRLMTISAFDVYGLPAFWEYQNPNTNQFEKDIPADSVIWHYEYLRPSWNHTGHNRVLNRIENFLRRSVITAVNGRIHNDNTVKNSGRQDMVIIHPPTTPDKQIDAAAKLTQQEYGYARQAAHSHMHLKGVDIKTLGQTIKDIDWQNSLRACTQDIYNAYGVGPEVHGLGEGNTFSNKGAAIRGLYYDTLMPLAKTSISDAHQHLLPNRDWRLYFPMESECPSMQEAVNGKIEGFTALTREGVKPRSASIVVGLDLTDEDIDPDFKENVAPSRRPNLTPPGGDQDERQNKKLENEKTIKKATAAIASLVVESAEAEEEEESEGDDQELHNEVITEQDKDVPEYKRVLKKYLFEQRSRVLQTLDEYSTNVGILKQDIENEDLVFANSIIDVDEENTLLRDSVIGLIAAIFGRGLALARRLITDSGRGFVAPNLDQQAESIESLVASVQQINTTTRDLIAEAYADARINGLSEAALAASIRAIYNDGERRATISTNETDRAYNEARRVSYQNSGVERHRWVTQGDDRVRDSHRAINGTVQEIGNSFIPDGTLRFPQDPLGPANEVINCRCITVPA